jgi:hypothetical protein
MRQAIVFAVFLLCFWLLSCVGGCASTNEPKCHHGCWEPSQVKSGRAEDERTWIT